MSTYQNNIGFRSIKSFDDDDDDDDDDQQKQQQLRKQNKFCNHYGSALQIVCHILVPLRKALIHFYLHHKNKKNQKISEDKIEEWKLLFELGLFFQAMIAVNNNNPKSTKSNTSKEEDSDDNDNESEPVDPTSVYLAIQAVIDKNNKKKKQSSSSFSSPKDATEAIQILLEMIQSCTRTLPVTSQLWSTLLDECGLGAIAKQTLIGKKKIENGRMLLQRTIRETRILLCPFPLIKDGQYTSMHEGLTNTMKQSLTSAQHNWELNENKANFEVKIPLWDNQKDGDDAKNSTWDTIKTMQFETLPNYWFVSIQRFVVKGNEDDKDEKKKEKQINDDNDKNDDSDSDDDDEKSLLNPLVDIPIQLDTTKFCTTACKNRIFNLVGGILYDDDDYVAILKNPNVVVKSATKSSSNSTSADKEKEDGNENNDDDDDDDEEIEDWNLMETDEIIPMTQDDAIEFLKGGNDGDDGPGGGVFGTVLVYKTTNTKELKSSDQLLSDIIISHVSGKLDSKIDFYYEEEIIE